MVASSCLVSTAHYPTKLTQSSPVLPRAENSSGEAMANSWGTQKCVQPPQLHSLGLSDHILNPSATLSSLAPEVSMPRQETKQLSAAEAILGVVLQ